MKLNDESKKYLESLDARVASKFQDEIYERSLYGEDLAENIAYINNFEGSTNTKVPYQFKKALIDGFYGGGQVATDWGDDQSGSLIGMLITNINDNPASVEKIFENKDASAKYIDVVWKACNHIAKNEYY